MSDDTRRLLDDCIELLQATKAEEVRVLDLRGLADFTDYFLLCTGNSEPHARALADAVLDGMKKSGHRPWHMEGYETRKWILFDFVEFVVHIFQPNARTFYGLERLWGDAPVEEIEDAPPLVEAQ